MANRVTQDEVAVIIELDLNTTPDITVFIDVANDLVTENCLDSDYSDDKLQKIELWLSAHFYAIKAPRAKTEAAGSVNEGLQSKVDIGFDVTHYGQMAMRIDSAGNLSAINEDAKKGNKPLTAGVVWAGTDPYTTDDE